MLILYNFKKWDNSYFDWAIVVRFSFKSYQAGWHYKSLIDNLPAFYNNFTKGTLANLSRAISTSAQMHTRQQQSIRLLIKTNSTLFQLPPFLLNPAKCIQTLILNPFQILLNHNNFLGMPTLHLFLKYLIQTSHYKLILHLFHQLKTNF